MAKGSKKSNFESLKFLAVLAAIFVIILVIYFISRGSEAKNPPIDISNSTTPSAQVTENTPGPVVVTDTPAPTEEVTATPEPSATPEATETPTPEVSATGEPTPTPTDTAAAPTPAASIKSSEAQKALETIVDPTLYSATLLSGAFSPSGDGETYYRYSIKNIATGETMTPEILVNTITASVYCYQDGKVFDCVQFPLDETEAGGEDSGTKRITSAEAVKILLSYGRDQLDLAKDPSSYTAQVDDEPTITLADADGIQAYLILLLDTDDRMVGAYAVSVDGIFVYVRDPLDPNSFSRIAEG